MKQKGIAFFSMVFLALALMALFVITQFFTDASTRSLSKGNLQAVQTFSNNNSIQELVNLSFDLQSKLKDRNLKLTPQRIKQLKDSLILLGYTATVLTTYTSEEDSSVSVILDTIIENQIDISERILNTYITNNIIQRNLLIDSLNIEKPGDKVYNNCLKLQKLLKLNLQQTLTTNSEQARKLTSFNRVLALLAIVAILVMATIIIKRQSQQLKLIDELKLAEQKALKSKTAKDEFLANMSHELRTPLNALIGFGNLLKDTPLNQQQKEYVDMIRSGGYNLLNIVNDVLDLSKIEAGKLSIVHKPFNLYSLFTRLEKMFSNTLKEKGLSYQSVIGANVPIQVIGDAERLQQIFVNLIGNAIKFTQKGGIQISTGITWADEEEKYYKLGFTVKDTGMGIPKNKIKTIFERFEQLEQGTQRQNGGTGLGLTIVKNLVEKMGGSISVFSEMDEGSEFNFTCILEKAHLTKEETFSVSKPQPFLANYHALVVEDNKANQTLLKYILGKCRLNITIADNGKEAVKILGKENFDLIFMDIQMPIMDGYTTIGILRNDLKIDTPVIAMTAYVSEKEIAKCIELGFNDYLAKPIDEKLLTDKTTKYLEPIFNYNDKDKNLDFLKELIGDDPATLTEVLSEMKAQWNKDKQDLLSACEEDDLSQKGRILHRLKSTFSPLGPNHSVYKIVHQDSEALTLPGTSGKEKGIRFVAKIDEALASFFNSNKE